MTSKPVALSASAIGKGLPHMRAAAKGQSVLHCALKIPLNYKSIFRFMKDLPVSAFTFSPLSCRQSKWNNFSSEALIMRVFYRNKRLLMVKNHDFCRKNEIFTGAWA
ncbi:MAG: hypothetical protein Q4A06_08360 [Cardiobacteriaceae bacterium]|nr:hypothetical protein [Cardiobacteriaceae bacterium]